MKNIFLTLIFIIPIYGVSQNNNYQTKVSSIDSTIKALYDVISGEKGEQRNWELLKFLFHKDAKLIPSGTNSSGKTEARFLTINEYINTSGVWLVKNGFFEKEIGRKTERFGNIAHVFSTYESFRTKNDSKPFMRGINSIQLLHDGNRWWILNVYWQSETQKDQIPKKYIDKN